VWPRPWRCQAPRRATLGSGQIPDVAVHFLPSLTWPEIRDLASARAVAVLPVGAIEAHGPHLPLATDVVIAEAMAREGAARLSARGFDVLVLPALPFAAAPFAAGFAGTVDVDGAAIETVVVGVARSLARHGIRVTAIANAHLDPTNVAALRRAQGRTSESGGVLVFADVTRRHSAERLTEEFRSGACHAGRYEGSVVLAERPDWVRTDLMRGLAPNAMSLVDAFRNGRRTFEEAGGADAYFGSPAEATAEEGRRIVQLLGEILADAVVEAMGSSE
jgi:creatinine amidohydrolase